MILTAKNGREVNFEELAMAGSYTLSHLNSNGVEVAMLTQMETYQTCAGGCEVHDGDLPDSLITASAQYERLRFIYRGSPRRWEQIA